MNEFVSSLRENKFWKDFNAKNPVTYLRVGKREGVIGLDSGILLVDLLLSVDWREASGFAEGVRSDRPSFCLTDGGRGCRKTDILVHGTVLYICIIMTTHSSAVNIQFQVQ